MSANSVKQIANPTIVADECITCASTSKVDGTIVHAADGISVASCAWVGSGNRVSDVTCSRGIRSSGTAILGGSCGSFGGLHACIGNVHAEDQNPYHIIYKLPMRPHSLPATSTSPSTSTRRLTTSTPPAWSPSLRASAYAAGSATVTASSDTHWEQSPTLKTQGITVVDLLTSAVDQHEWNDTSPIDWKKKSVRTHCRRTGVRTS